MDCKKPKPCSQPPKQQCCDPATPEFSLCIGDYALTWAGKRATVERTRQTPDGTYTSVTVQNGCIVAYGTAPIASYTPPYCAPAPDSCGGVNATAPISPQAGNTLSSNAGGLYAHTYIQGQTGIVVTGSGTATDPFVITGQILQSGSLVGRNGVAVNKSDEGNHYVGLTATGVTAGQYGRFTVDEYGRITGIENNREGGVKVGDGLEARADGDDVLIAHPKQNFADNPQFGGWTAVFNTTGHLTDLTRAINIEAGTYRFGLYEVTVNGFGSITNIRQSHTEISEAGSFQTADGKTVHYDETGRIYRITTPQNNQSGSNNGQPTGLLATGNP